ncbi:unnamed protein product, partial [marine sediment metagenome]
LQKKERKNKPINLRIKSSDSIWLRKNNVSPQRLFDQALEDLKKSNPKKKQKNKKN